MSAPTRQRLNTGANCYFWKRSVRHLIRHVTLPQSSCRMGFLTFACQSKRGAYSAHRSRRFHGAFPDA